MDLARFVDSRRSRWAQLESLLARAEKDSIAKLSLGDARSLSRLYRSASGDLLWVRARGASADVADYLNDLVARAYALTYPPERPRLAHVLRFIGRGFPLRIRAELRSVIAAILLTAAGGIFGAAGMRFDVNAREYLIPAQHQRIDPIQRARSEQTHSVASADEQAAFASFLFTHNISVAFLCFALGLTAGVGTAVMLFVNGLLLGALAQEYASKGLAGWFWAWILPHGIPELTAICIAGAGGFVLSRALIAPGGLSRRQALRREANQALELLLGSMLLFVVAGLVEGTISQIHPPRLSVAFKIGFALVLGTGVYAYLGSALFSRRPANP